MKSKYQLLKITTKNRKLYQPLTMNTSSLNGVYIKQECSRNMDTSDETIRKTEDNKETVNYSVDYDVCKSKDTSGCQTKSKRFHETENDSEVFASQSKRIKTVQRFTLTEAELLKQPNDNGMYDGREYEGTNDSQDNDGTDDSQEDDSTDDSQDNNATCDSQDEYDTDDSQDDDDTDDSQEDDDSYDGHKDSCNKIDEADLFYGAHETQVSEGGEADLHKHFVDCKKNPGHTKFVPVNNFNINHLPEGHHDNDLVEFIKATADLTVRVAVKMTSTERPEFWPNTTVPYAFYNMRGSDVMRVGTGLVTYVTNWTEEDDRGTCQCHKCQHSDTPSKVWGEVGMYTATHVVFDDLEARHTTCRLFYDGQDSPLVTLDGWTVKEANIEEDRCCMECVTCDVDLMDNLVKMVRHWWDQWNKVNNKYSGFRDNVNLIFIVSHPHGCSKQISVGHWIKRFVVDHGEGEGDDMTQYTYTTCTCPGSSGAYVHPLGYDGAWYNDRHVHGGVNSKGNNYSGVGYE